MDDSLSADLLDDVHEAPMYPSYSSRNLTAKFSRDDHNDEGEQIDFLKDDPKEMTASRRLALSLMDKKWYNPLAGQEEEEKGRNLSVSGRLPSIKRAWAYFEHTTLMRYCDTGVNSLNADMTLWERYRYAGKNKDEQFERAKPGETKRPTRLYDWLATPHMQLGDFGMGFGLYFR